MRSDIFPWQRVNSLTPEFPPSLTQLQETADRLGFAHPIVGVHVRRTDKVGTEAAFHSIEEYMAKVDDWFKKYELLHPSFSSSGRKRNVFLATDEPLLLEEAKTKYETLGCSV